MDNAGSIASGTADVATRIMNGEDPQTVALNVAMNNAGALKNVATNDGAMSVINSLVTD